MLISKTKLQTPQFNEDYLPRTTLVQSVATAVSRHRLTLISAPAGSGKTTLAASAVHAAADRLTTVWLRLDANENDPQSFVTAVVLALQTDAPQMGKQALLLMQNAPDPAQVLNQALTMLVNELHDDATQRLIVLDDYHAIENAAVHQAVDYWLSQLPPQTHLLLTTRYDPPLSLARLRLRGQLAEIRLEQLRFNVAETQQYLTHQLAVDLSADQLRHLQTRTDGWIAGVRLLALTLDKIHDASERDRFIRQFSRSNQLVFDLLAEEVFEQQPAAMRDFLRQTSVLDELTPDLCTAVTQNQGAPQLLADAYKRNLFLTATNPFASADTAYRYHDLFADLLRRKLAEQGEAVWREVQMRAGQAHPVPAQAVEHFLQAQAWEAAAQLILQLSEPQLRRRHINQQTISWIARLPQEMQQTNNWLQLIVTFHRAQVGDISMAVIDELMEIREGFRKEGDKKGEYLTLLAAAQSSGGYFEEVLQEVRQFFQANPGIVEPEDEIGILLSAAWGAEERSDWEQLTQNLRQMLEMWRTMTRLHYIVGQGFGLPFFFSDLGMTPIINLVENMTEIHGEGDNLVHLGIHNQRSNILFYQARLDEAFQESRRSRLLMARLGNLAWQASGPNFIELNFYLARGDYAALHRFCEALLPELRADPSIAFSMVGMLYARGLAFWCEGKIKELIKIADSLTINAPTSQTPGELHGSTELVTQPMPNRIRESPYLPVRKTLLLLAGWAALAREQFAEAKRCFLEAVTLHQKVRHTFLGGHPRLDIACLHWLWYQKTGEAEKLKEAEAHLDILLTELADRKMPGILLQTGRVAIPLLRHVLPTSPYTHVIEPALTAFGEIGQFRPIPIPNSEESLTPREVEVLHLLLKGATNRDIAKQLVVTTRTAKAHVSNILQKLGVTSRTQAVAAARDLSLL